MGAVADAVFEPVVGALRVAVPPGVSRTDSLVQALTASTAVRVQATMVPRTPAVSQGNLPSGRWLGMTQAGRVPRHPSRL
ncbi:hypothetical protein IDVR_13390 [Intrasporangium sp. DVR]